MLPDIGEERDSLIGRLVYGCGRLTGGASLRGSLRLLEMVFDAGIRAVDVAPSYGMGTAETVVGKAVRQHPSGAEVRIITKVGIPAPRWRTLKTMMRATKRLMFPPGPRDFGQWHPVEPADSFRQGNFEEAPMAASVTRSLSQLGRFDALLLHACGPGELTAQVRNSIETLSSAHGAQPGYAIASRYDGATDQGFPSFYFAECAIDPAFFERRHASPARRDILFHSLVPTANYLSSIRPEFENSLVRASSLLPQSDPATARMAATYALAAEREPGARFVFSSTQTSRLASLLQAFRQIDEGKLGPEIAALFD